MECLVTKLKGVVNDDSLLKMGEMRIKKIAVSSGWNKVNDSFTIRSKGKNNVLSIIGNGYFTDATGSANNGKTLKITAGSIVTVYVSNGSYEISVEDKYAIDVLALNPSLEITYKGTPSHFEFGDLSSIGSCNDMFVLMLSSMGVTGDISALKNMDNIQQLYLENNEGISGDISILNGYTKATQIVLNRCKNIYGNISGLSDLNLLETISLYESEGIVGSTEVFQNLTKLKEVQIWGTGITGGDISVFNGKSNLYNLSAEDITFSGDFFDVLASKNYMNFSVKGDFTYSSKNFNGKSYGIVGGVYFNCTNLDGFLNDFQQASIHSLTNIHSIIMNGARTSASDSAISTLQGKGFTVTVPTATDANSISTMSLDTENFGIAYKDKDLIVEPVDLTEMQIFPASGVTVKKFDTKENAEKYIKDNGLVKTESK